MKEVRGIILTSNLISGVVPFGFFEPSLSHNLWVPSGPNSWYGHKDIQEQGPIYICAYIYVSGCGSGLE